MIRISNINYPLTLDETNLPEFVAKKYKLSDIRDFKIVKQSIDARKKNDIHYVYTVDVSVDNEDRFIRKNKAFIKAPVNYYKPPKCSANGKKVVIAGFGPAGFMCAHTLAKSGFKVIVLERGEAVDERIKSVQKLKDEGILNPESNVQFGEGGAGTFSDGKLTTGVNDERIGYVLNEFAKHGAPNEITYRAKPHIGTDKLRSMVKAFREDIIKMGGDVRFSHKLTAINIEKGKLASVCVNDEYEIETDTLILATGHSARDIFEMMKNAGANMERKVFAIGARIEHLQKDINFAQYGDECKFELPPAEYKLVYHAKNGRACYTFCMCPGGQVMASSSDEDTVVTNGMSKFARDGKNANSALLVEVKPEDCGGTSPLAGMYFQEALEKKAFLMGGLNYYAPAQKVGDYLKGEITTSFGKVEPTYKPGVMPSNLNELFPGFVNETLKESIIELDKKMHGFADKDAVLTAVETRTSSPVQITRDKNTLMSNVYGIYPCGEGAGYAGGIMTAAVDGIKVAIKILEKE